MVKERLLLDRNLQIIFGVTLMAVLGVASITPAFPKIMRELNITGGQVGLLITFFSLPGAILAPFFGVLADRFGRKRILVPSLFLFAVAGTACAFTEDFGLLLILRAIQGVGAAALGSLNTAVLSDLYTGNQRVAVMGLNASVLSIGTAAYPLIGGTLALIGWHYPFALPVFAIPIGVMVLISLRNPEPKRVEGLREYLSSVWRYLKNVTVIGLFGTGLLTFIILYGAFLTYFALLLGDSFGASPFIIGVMMSGMSVTTALVSAQLGRISKWFSLGVIIILAFVIYSLALFLIPFMTSIWLLLIPVILYGVGHGANIPSIHAVLSEVAPLEYRAALMSINATVLRLGQALGPPLMSLAYVLWGFEATFFTAAALALVVPIIGTVFRRRLGS